VVEDIMRNKQYTPYHETLSNMLAQCADELEALISTEGGGESVLERIRDRIEAIYGLKDYTEQDIRLDQLVKQRLDHLSPAFSHRQLRIIQGLTCVPVICMPAYVMEKVIDGLIKNAVENTPDGGKLEVTVRKKELGAVLVVHDSGVGITQEHQKRIFEGFFTIQDTMAYSTKQVFNFNAGGKGADLLRMRIFSERYGFTIDMDSSRCGHIPRASDVCPGNIRQCPHCTDKQDCYRSGGTTFSIYFPSASSGQ